MKVKEILNQYEFDWASFVARQKDYPFHLLKNKNVFIAGGQNSFARAVVCYLFSLNDIQNLNMQIYLIANDTSVLNGVFVPLSKRDDFKFYTIDAFENTGQNLKSDYFIFTGCCNKRIDNTPEFFIEEISSANNLLAVAKKLNTKHFILLSDYRAYGLVKRGVKISEYENGLVDFSSNAGFESEVIQTIENLVVSNAKQSGFNYTILRCGIVLGASVGLDESIFTDLFKSVAKEEEFEIINSTKQYSFVYITDVLKALFFSKTMLRKNTVYNVVGKDATLSTGMLCAIIHDTFPYKSKISLNAEIVEPSYGAAMNNQKIIAFGCEPEVTVQHITELLVSFYNNENGENTFLFSDTYQGKLDVIHNILLGYLLEVDRICRKHNIKYFLAGGTLLGAIRHKGFIPWDDDADVMMLREDYEKFLSVVESELPSNITLHTPNTDEKTHCVFTKLRIDNTMFATKFTSMFPDMHNGIFFDVLCHDNTANSKIGKKIHLQLTLLTRSLVFNKWHKRKVNNGHKIQSAVATVLKTILPMKFLEWCQYRCLKFFKNKKDAEYLYDGMGRNVYNGDFPKKWLEETVYWEFEGHYFPIPKEYDNYLKYLYGDYKEMVPAFDRQTSHSIVIMDLGEYGKYNIPPKFTTKRDKIDE